MNIDRICKEINKTLQKPAFRNGDVTYIMSNFRLLIEEKKLQDKYIFLNLYCNWSLHSEISRCRTAYRILEFLTDSFINHYKDPKNSRWINDLIIEGLSLHKLLEDIINIGQEYKIIAASKFSDLNSWILFAKVLVNVLIERPLTFPEPMTSSAKPIYDSIIKKATDSGYKDISAVVGIQFIYFPEFPTQQHWEIKTLHTIAHKIRICGPIAFINQDIINKFAVK